MKNFIKYSILYAIIISSTFLYSHPTKKYVDSISVSLILNEGLSKEKASLFLEDLELFSNIISWVESSNGVYNYGDYDSIQSKYLAIGPLQIHKGCITDVNNMFNVNFTHDESLLNNDTSSSVFKLYLLKGLLLYKKKYNKYPTDSELSRMWNGGIYSGYKRDATIVYASLLNTRKFKMGIRSNIIDFGKYTTCEEPLDIGHLNNDKKQPDIDYEDFDTLGYRIDKFIQENIVLYVREDDLLPYFNKKSYILIG